MAVNQLGQGIVAPFRRDGKGDFLSANDGSLIKSSVLVILGTLGASDFTFGEVPWRTELGSLLPTLRHRNNDAVLRGLADAFVVRALQSQEPRLSVASTEILSEDNKLRLKARFQVRGTDVPENRVFSQEVPI